MSCYAFWNNKGGIGKSFLGFVAASEYAHLHRDSDVYVIDLCPQANISETLLHISLEKNGLSDVLKKTPRATVGGYLEARLNSPFSMISNIDSFVTKPSKYNKHIPENLYLVCGDNLLEIIAEAIRQTSQLSIPINSWFQVQNWIKDLALVLKRRNPSRNSIIIIDCNPSFAIYTQLAIVAADYLILPFTPDESSHRAVKNVLALVYGHYLEDSKINAYAKINFAQRASDENVALPKLHTFISNRVTIYEGNESKAFRAISKTIKATIDGIHNKYKRIFAYPLEIPSKKFITIPDYHGASVYAAANGIPIHQLKPGPKDFRGERVQLNKDPLEKYRASLLSLVNRL